MSRYIHFADAPFDTMTNDELYAAILAIRGTLESRKRPAIHRNLSRWQWAQERAEMRLQLALLTELLALRSHVAEQAAFDAMCEDAFAAALAELPEHLRPLPDSRSGFDSDLCTPQELQMLAARQKAKPDGTTMSDRPTLLLLATICNMRRALKAGTPSEPAAPVAERLAA